MASGKDSGTLSTERVKSPGKGTDNSKGDDGKDEQKKDADEIIDFGLIEDDDEFEEFEPGECPEEDETQYADYWDDDWDDDTVEVDFGERLKAELEKQRVQKSESSTKESMDSIK